MAKLMMFHGRECPHCKKMMPLVEKLEKELNITFEKHEVWHDEKNADLMRSFRPVFTAKCGGQLKVPAFLNVDANDAFCGEVEYEKLKDWTVKQTAG
jgi:thiol-disulfide isomerase/thioredoxin